MTRVAVVGAGIAGLSCARALLHAGLDVTVFDKGRSVGGRLSTRRMPPHAWDLGAPYFTARTESFRREAELMAHAGVCVPWHGVFVSVDEPKAPLHRTKDETRWVGVPGMNAVARHLATDLEVRTGHRIDAIAREGSGWTLHATVAPEGVTLGPRADDRGAMIVAGTYDHVMICIPSSQAVPLLAEVSAELARIAAAAPLDPCTVLLFVPQEEDAARLRALPFDAAFVGRDPSPRVLSFAIRDSSKPGRDTGERWALHATPTWSRVSAADDESEVTASMLSAFCETFDIGPVRASVSSLRRWLLARAAAPLERGAIFDSGLRIGMAGDWASDGRIEGAFASGAALAATVLESFGPRT